MKDLEIIKSKEGKYGIRNSSTKKVIIPCMYDYEDICLVEEIEELGDEKYSLKGTKNDKTLYGLYDEFKNKLIPLKYEKIMVNSKGIELINGKETKLYNEIEKEDYEVIPQKIIEKSGKYGLELNDLKVPCNYKRDELINIMHYEEALPGLYILFNNNKQIIGFFDDINIRLELGTFTSYEIIKDTLILKNRVKVTKQQKPKEDYISSKTYVSLYNSKYNVYVHDENHVDVENEIYQSDGYTYKGYSTRITECMKEIDGIFILNKNTIFDSNTGIYENNGILIKVNELNKRIELYYEDAIKIYNIITKEYTIYEKAKDGNKENSFYISTTNPDEIILRDFNLPKVKIFSDFYIVNTNCIDYKTIIYDKNYNEIVCINEKIDIIEIYPNLANALGIVVKEEDANHLCSVYLINGKIYYFNPKRRANMFATNVESMLPFEEVPKNNITAIECEYGTICLDANSEAEIEYLLDKINHEELEELLKRIYNNSKILQKEYPTLVKRK